MRLQIRIICGCALAALGLCTITACEKVGRYGPPPPSTGSVAKASDKDKPADDKDKGKDKEKKPVEPEPLDPSIAWEKPIPSLMAPEVPIQFVHSGTHAAEWDQLKQFWNGPTADQVGALMALDPVAQAAALAKMDKTVRIKVPVGLDDPAPHIPAANPPTVGKWELGRQLFHEESYLDPSGKISCAGCHRPSQVFTDNSIHMLRNTPTLINSVYNTHFFWDGRAAALEEVVQMRPEDERLTPGTFPKPHSWSGVIERLRKSPKFSGRFETVFGTRATQDAVGKALATYLRTFLVADSIQDRAEQAMRTRKANALEPGDYEKLLDKDVLQALGKDVEKDKPADVAKQIHAGYTLFRGQARCVQCHSGPTYSDNGFHNLGVGDSGQEPFPGRETGRFAVVPLGQKDRRLIGAYKTPTLRALPRTSPYFHDGRVETLTDVVELHIQGGRANPNLDPELRDEKDPSKPRSLGLKPEDTAALVLFLRALDGSAVDPIFATPK